MDYASYAEDTTPYVWRQHFPEAIEFLEPYVSNIFARFKNNGLAANSGKSHFLVITYDKISFKILSSAVESSPCEGLLGITIDSVLIFHKPIISLCSKANQKLSALVSRANYLTIDKLKILLNSPKFTHYGTMQLLKRIMQCLVIEAYKVKNGIRKMVLYY